MSRDEIGGPNNDAAIQAPASKRRKLESDSNANSGFSTYQLSFENPTNPFETEQAALHCYTSRQYKKALGYFDDLPADHINEHNLYCIAACHFHVNNLEKAKESFIMALEVRPDEENIYAFDSLSYVFLISTNQGKQKDSAAFYQRLLSIERCNPESINRIDMIGVMTNEDDKKIISGYESYQGAGLSAVADIDRSLYAMMLSLVSNCYFESKDFSKLDECYGILCSDNLTTPEYREKLFYSFCMSYKNKNSDDSETREMLFAKAKQHANMSYELNTFFIWLAVQDENWDELELYCQAALATSPGVIDVIKYFCEILRCLVKSDLIDGAIKLLQLIPAISTQEERRIRDYQCNAAINVFGERYIADPRKKDDRYFFFLVICNIILGRYQEAGNNLDFIIQQFGVESAYFFDVQVCYFILPPLKSGLDVRSIYASLLRIFAESKLSGTVNPVMYSRYEMVQTIVYAHKNKLIDAAASYHKAISEREKDPSIIGFLLHAVMLRKLSFAYYKNSDYERAKFYLCKIHKNAWTESVQKTLVVYWIFLYKNFIGARKGRDNVGMCALQEASKVRISDERCNMLLAQIAYQVRRWDELKNYSEAVISVNPSSENARSYLVLYYIEHKMLDQALEILQGFAQEKREEHALTLAYYGVVYYLQGEIKKAKESLDKALIKNGDIALALTYRARIHLDDGEYELADRVSQKAIDGSDKQPDSLMMEVQAKAAFRGIVCNERGRTTRQSLKKRSTFAAQVIRSLHAEDDLSRRTPPQNEHGYLPRGGQLSLMKSLKNLATGACMREAATACLSGGHASTVFAQQAERKQPGTVEHVLARFDLS
jgi:tetratricopeptide (TPR) repeat protein